MTKNFTINDFLPEKIDIKFKFKSIKLTKEIILEICILKVKGNYPYGSQGAPIGEYLRGLGVFLIEIFSLDALIVDLSFLNYRWGNNLLRVAQPEMLQTSDFVGNTWLGYYILGSKKNKKALEGLFIESKASKIKKIYLNINEAFKDIIQKGKKVYRD